jgi:hypothetical protein
MRGAHGRIQLGTLLTYLQICIRPLLTMRATTLAMARRMKFTASIREKGLLQLSAQTNVRASPFKSKRANASPDVSMVTAIDNYEAIGDFFKGFALPRV